MSGYHHRMRANRDLERYCPPSRALIISAVTPHQPFQEPKIKGRTSREGVKSIPKSARRISKQTTMWILGAQNGVRGLLHVPLGGKLPPPDYLLLSEYLTGVLALESEPFTRSLGKVCAYELDHNDHPGVLCLRVLYIASFRLSLRARTPYYLVLFLYPTPI